VVTRWLPDRPVPVLGRFSRQREVLIHRPYHRDSSTIKTVRSLFQLHSAAWKNIRHSRFNLLDRSACAPAKPGV
jgi:hypothetical protein